MPFNVHPLFIIAVLVIVLIIFGPGKLPELGGAIGKGIREFRKASNELKDEITRSTSVDETSSSTTAVDEPPVPAPVAAAPAPPKPRAKAAPKPKA